MEANGAVYEVKKPLAHLPLLVPQYSFQLPFAVKSVDATMNDSRLSCRRDDRKSCRRQERLNDSIRITMANSAQ